MRLPGDAHSRRWTAASSRWVAAALLLAAVTPGANADDSAVKSRHDVASAGGAEIYARICRGCHMPDAQGAAAAGRYPKLAGDPALASWEYVALTVLIGRNGMPGFAEPEGQELEFLYVRLSDAEVAEVVNYVRSNFGNHYKSRVTGNQVAALPHPRAAAQ